MIGVAFSPFLIEPPSFLTCRKVSHWEVSKPVFDCLSPVAVRVIKDKLKKAGCINFVDCNPYLTKPEWRLINGHIFADKVIEYMGFLMLKRLETEGLTAGRMIEKEYLFKLKIQMFKFQL